MKNIYEYDFYVDDFTGDTLLVYSQYNEHMTLVYPNDQKAFMCRHETFNSRVSNNELIMARYLLDCSYTPYREHAAERNLTGFGDLKQLYKGLNNMEKVLAQEDFIINAISLTDLTSKSNLYTGTWVAELRSIVKKMAIEKTGFKPSPVNIEQVITKLGLNSNNEDSPNHIKRKPS